MKKEYLYSPWRIDYILSPKSDGCIFCDKPIAGDDATHLIVHRSKHCYVILNLYPYNNGHVMVVPYLHSSSLSALPEAVLNDLFATVALTEKVISNLMKSDGMNIGINLGKAAGAGIDEHVHVHVVPRWIGDANFMSAAGGMRVIPEPFENTYAKLTQAFEQEETGK